MAKIIITCDECGTEREVDDKLAGSILQCANCEANLRVPLPNISEGTNVGGFILERQLGFGAMGEVWLARQTAMDRLVAVKLLSREFTLDSRFVDRFLKEVRISAKMDHPNIITAFDAGRDNDIHYLAITYVDGCTLEDRIDELGILPEKEALGIIIEIAEALSYAWREFSMLHRDIKPANIMIDTKGSAKLMDMGISKMADEQAGLTMTGTIIGTPYYMSPEQGMGEKELDFHSDIYSLGATLYHIVTGVLPFDATTALGIVSKHITEPLPSPLDKNPNLSEACSALIEIMMAKGMQDRQGSWSEVVTDMRLVLEGEFPVSKPRPSPGDSLIMPAAHSQPTVAIPNEEAESSESLATQMFDDDDDQLPPSHREKPKTMLMVLAAVVVLVGVFLAVFMLRTKEDHESQRFDEQLFSDHADKVSPPEEPAEPPPENKPERMIATTKKPPRDEPIPHPRKDEKIQRCENMWKFAKDYVESNPRGYDLGIKNFQELSKHASGTKFKMMADVEVSKLRKAKRGAVSAILAELKSQSDSLAESGDFIKAVDICRNYSGALAEETKADREDMAVKYKRRGDQIAEENNKKRNDSLRQHNDTMYEVASNMLGGNWSAAKSVLKNSGIDDARIKKLADVINELAGARKTFMKNLSRHTGEYVTLNSAKGRKRIKIKRVRGRYVYCVEKKGTVVLQKRYSASKISKEDVVRIAALSEDATLAYNVAVAIKNGDFSVAASTLSVTSGPFAKLLKAGVRELMAKKSLEFLLRRAGINNADIGDQEAVIEEISKIQLTSIAKGKRRIIIGKYRAKFAGTRFFAEYEPILNALELSEGEPKDKLKGDHDGDDADPHRKVSNDPHDRGDDHRGGGERKLDLSRLDPNSIRSPEDMRDALRKISRDYDNGGIFRFGRKGNLVIVDLGECGGVDNNSLKLLKLFPDIKVMILCGTDVTDISLLKNLKLAALDLAQCAVKDLSPLENMKTLKALRINGSGVNSLFSLKKLPLRLLDMSDTKINDIRPLSRMPLEGLRMLNCKLRSYTILRKLKKLKALEPQNLWRKVPGKADNEFHPQDFPDFRRSGRDRREERSDNSRDDDDL